VRKPPRRPLLKSLLRKVKLFSLAAELAKIKIPVPLTELISRSGYRSQVLKALAIEPSIGTKALTIGSGTHSDTVNLAEVQGKKQIEF
jgi:hypothetical protein